MSSSSIESWATSELNVGFSVESGEIQTLSEPIEFYQKLVELARLAQKRISISSLYIGNGDLATGLIDIIAERRQAGISALIVIDGMRQSRSKPMFMENYKSVRIACYKNPLARYFGNFGLERIIEIYQVHHMKYYVFDDTVLLSG